MDLSVAFEAVWDVILLMHLVAHVPLDTEDFGPSSASIFTPVNSLPQNISLALFYFFPYLF